MTDFSLRTMTSADIPAVHAIERQVQWAPWSTAIFRASLGPRYIARVAVSASATILGYALCDSVLDECTLHNIGVSPLYQRQGIGRALLQALLAYYQQQKMSAMFLEVRRSNQTAYRLYHQLGFVEVGCRKNYYPTADGKEDALLMRHTFA